MEETKMDLKIYERTYFNRYIVPMYKKDRCECCGATEDLDLHHEERFIESLRKTLKLFNLEEKDTSEYTEEELDIITNYMLGIQIKQKYKTLCRKCHIEEHSKSKQINYNVNYNERYGIETIRITDEEEVKEKLERIKNNYIPKILNKKLTSKDKDEICNVFGLIDSKGMLIKWTRVKIIIEALGFKITDGRCNIKGKQIRYSVITE